MDRTSPDLTRLMDAHLALIATDVERWLALFTEDAVVEFPYASSLGGPARMEGIAAIRAWFAPITKHFQGLTFTNARRYPGVDATTGWLEVHGAATLQPGNIPYEQDYVMRLQVRDGRIVHYREYWNPLAAPRGTFESFTREQA
ncbi:nuclear transport factor 2 family protein [Corallococcus carmarthensis]|uniref:Nuclear transport factor 2 family protein n=1 Tax=Corallococcus carmarthensis TaxID=2316728 RepID=A0A3A8KJ17_9BACT|nr:nuclear transport factor 2 family protein [Corallococcus carmarthensis]NOK20192.1 nuclear transport factor 2 family protein [Corallococcus carmarthensis]RKH01914.1 nuclear transport factor 2 family protein [Corallococcus carmarthensis]